MIDAVEGFEDPDTINDPFTIGSYDEFYAETFPASTLPPGNYAVIRLDAD